MSEHEIEPLEPDLHALLDVERSPPGMPREMASRVLQRVEASTGLGGASPGGQGPSAGAGRGGARGLLSRRLPFGAAMFVLGALTGAALHAALRPPARPTTVTRYAPPQPARVNPPPEPPPVTPTTPSRTEVPDAALTTRPAPAPTVVTTPPAAPVLRGSESGRDVDLAAERALLEVARTALARGQVDAALDAVQRHARRFPRGQLVEERESVWIQSLAAADRGAEARQRAAEFRRRFPQSILRPVVEAAVRSIP